MRSQRPYDPTNGWALRTCSPAELAHLCRAWSEEPSTLVLSGRSSPVDYAQKPSSGPGPSGSSGVTVPLRLTMQARPHNSRAVPRMNRARARNKATMRTSAGKAMGSTADVFVERDKSMAEVQSVFPTLLASDNWQMPRPPEDICPAKTLAGYPPVQGSDAPYSTGHLPDRTGCRRPRNARSLGKRDDRPARLVNRHRYFCPVREGICSLQAHGPTG